MRYVIAIAGLFVASAASAAAPRMTGTFSNLRFGTEDVTGVEISVVYGGNEHYAIVQCAEGAPGVPEVVIAKLQGATLSFQLAKNTRSGCPSSEFRGTISAKGLTGSFQGTTWPGYLPRGKGYWQ